jgi:rsbT co-antagonist protein RsbR
MLRTLTQKVTFVTLIFLGLFVIAVAVVISNILVIRDAAAHLGEHTVEQVELSGQFNTDMFRGLAEALSYAHTHEPDNRDSARQEMRDAKTLSDQLAALDAQPDPYAPELVAENHQVQQRRVAMYNQFQPQVEDLLGAVESNNAEQITRALGVLNEQKGELEQLEEDSGSLADRSIAAATNAAATRVRVAIISVGVSFGILVLLVLGILILLQRRIVRPVKAVAAAAHDVAQGQLDQTLAVTGDDEIGDLQRTFNQMVQNLRSSRAIVAEQQRALTEQTADLERTLSELRESTTAQEQLNVTVRSLASPVVPVLEGILVMPLIGVIDTERASLLMQSLLTTIEQRGAQIVIIDVTGVPLIDTQVARTLLQVGTAVHLLGAQMVLVGLRPEVAQTLVGLGIDLAQIVTRADLQSGVSYALGRRGQRPGNGSWYGSNQ